MSDPSTSICAMTSVISGVAADEESTDPESTARGSSEAPPSPGLDGDVESRVEAPDDGVVSPPAGGLAGPSPRGSAGP